MIPTAGLNQVLQEASFATYPEGFLFPHKALLCAILPGGGKDTLCGYVRLFHGHPFEGREYSDREIRRLSGPLGVNISFAEHARFRDATRGWWIGFFTERAHGLYYATPAESMAFAVKETQKLAEALLPRRSTMDEASTWLLEAMDAALGSNLPCFVTLSIKESSHVSE